MATWSRRLSAAQNRPNLGRPSAEPASDADPDATPDDATSDGAAPTEPTTPGAETPTTPVESASSDSPSTEALSAIDMSGERVIEMLTDTLVVTSDIVAIFSSVGAEALWANDAFATAIPIREADKIWLIELLDEWSKAHYEVNVLPALVQYGRWHGRLTLEPSPGEELLISASIVAHRDDAGEIEAVSLVARDLRDLQAAEELVQASESRLAALVENAADIIFVLDGDARIRYASPAAARLLGLDDDELRDMRLLDLVHDDDAPKCDFSRLARPDRDGIPATSELRFRHRDGGWRHFEVVATDLSDNPAIGGVVLNARDVTDRVEATARLADRAFTDPLTLLPNRMRLADRLERALHDAPDQSVAVILADVDRFKAFNELHGHSVGDDLLRQAAQRLTGLVAADQMVARLGGNEFAIVMGDLDNVDDALALAERVRAEMAQPFAIQGKDVEVTVSVGVAVSVSGYSPESLVGDADIALGMAKDSDGNRVEILTADLRTNAKRRAQVEQLLRRVLDENEGVQVHYQPIFDVATGRIASAEALLRVHDDDGELLSPAAFLDAAESSGLIAPLGRQVMLETCRQLVAWTAADQPDTPREISVNVSPRQIADVGFPTMVAEALAETGIEPARLSLELTESMLIGQSGAIDDIVQEVRQLGLRIGLDDFGAGQSSLGYLKRFPLDFVKIDRGLVAGVGTNEADTAIVRATIELAHSLGLQVTAVGVETDEQLEILELLGCDRAQGFYFAPAVPADEFVAHVNDRT
jgi:diguanylate cyclase (GGDEF)-like protein/PAS domain S-box-containing protein